MSAFYSPVGRFRNVTAVTDSDRPSITLPTKSGRLTSDPTNAPGDIDAAIAIRWLRRRLRLRQGDDNTCFHLTGRNINVLIDCGASSLISMNKLAINRNNVNTIFLTHFHEDHVGGVPFYLLEANYVLKRDQPLTIAGPPSLKSRFGGIMEAGFPGTRISICDSLCCLRNWRSASAARSAACG